MLNNGCFVRMINVVVDTYNGIAANINMPNTKPGNPCNPARAIYRQCMALKMLK